MITIVVLAVVTLICYKISDTFNTQITANSSAYTVPEGQNVHTQVNNQFSGIIDNSMLFIMVGLSIVAISLAMAVRVHPIFFVFYIIMLVVIIFLSGAFANIYLKMANMPEFYTLADKLTFTSTVIGFLPFFVGILGFILAIVMYKNFQAAQ